MAAKGRPGTTGPALLLIHGFLDDRTVWDPVIARLSGRYAVTADDLPGWGSRSGDGGPFTLQRLAEAVIGELDATDGQVILVGHSMGAPIAELAATARAAKVAGLVLLTPVPLAGVHLDGAMASGFRSLGGDAEAQRVGRRAVAVSADDAALDALVRTGLLARPETVAETFDAWNDGDPGGELPSRYTGPTLIIRGAADPFVSEEMLRSGVLSRFPSARRGEIAGVGHMPHVEDPAEVARLIGEFAISLGAVPADDGNRTGEVSGQAWTDAFAQQSADAFGNAFADDVVLEAATLRVPVRGKKDVQVTMETASAYYAGLVFTHEAVSGPRTYLEWEAEAPSGTKFSGVTVLTRNADGLVGHVAIHHRPLDAALEFSAEMNRRTQGKIPPGHFYSIGQPSGNI